MHSTAWAVLLLVGAATFAVAAGHRAELSQPSPSRAVGVLDEHPVIQYADRPTRDRVAALNQTLAQGGASLAFQERGGYLRPLLDALGVAAESQLLVFSKMGIQGAVTGPLNPRALFFDDSVVIGYIPGARWIEVAAHDPDQGVVFYTIEQTATAKPAFARRTDCLTCHVASSTLEVPGMIVRSNFMTPDGGPIPQLGFHIVNHRTPLPNRWGGWYVTGNYTTPPYGGIGHMGNVTTSVHPASGPVTTSNEIFIHWLDSGPEARGYPSSDSDIAALMVFDHQMHAINLLTRLNWEFRVAASANRATSTDGMLRDLADEVADYLLFVDEVPPPARLTPRADFAQKFSAAAPRDRHGRSLRQLNLETRLLQYPCSYMVYSAAFDNLPAAARTAVYQRMWTILSGGDSRAKYSHLSTADRRAVMEILLDTKHDLPEIFRGAAQP